MREEPGQETGQPPAGLSWGELLGGLVETHGTLTAVAWKLVEHGDDVASIALRADDTELLARADRLRRA